MTILNPNSANSTAYTSVSGDRTAPNTLATILAAGTEYSGAQLNTISTDDVNKVTAAGANAAHLIKYRVLGTETQLDFTIKAEDSGPSASDIYFYIWNDNSTAWELMDQDTVGAIRTMTDSITTNVANYIDATDDVWVLATSGLGGMHNLDLYYAQSETTAAVSSSSSSSSNSSSSSSSSPSPISTISYPIYRSFKSEIGQIAFSKINSTASIFEGAAIAIENGNIAVNINSSVKFIGFAIEQSIRNKILVRTNGTVRLNIAAEIGDSVYMTGQNSFDVTGTIKIGVVEDIIDSGSCWVYFDAFQL